MEEALSAPEISPCSNGYEVVFKLVLPFWAAGVDGLTSYVYPIIITYQIQLREICNLKIAWIEHMELNIPYLIYADGIWQRKLAIL